MYEKSKKLFLPLIEHDAIIYMYFFFQVFFGEIGNIHQELYLSLSSSHNNMGIEPTGKL